VIDNQIKTRETPILNRLAFPKATDCWEGYNKTNGLTHQSQEREKKSKGTGYSAKSAWIAISSLLPASLTHPSKSDADRGSSFLFGVCMGDSRDLTAINRSWKKVLAKEEMRLGFQTYSRISNYLISESCFHIPPGLGYRLLY